MEKINIEIKEKFDERIKEDKGWDYRDILFLIILNGFIEYYYYMKWVKGKSADQVVKELTNYPQDFINVIFLTCVNNILLYLLLF